MSSSAPKLRLIGKIELNSVWVSFDAVTTAVTQSENFAPTKMLYMRSRDATRCEPSDDVEGTYEPAIVNLSMVIEPAAVITEDRGSCEQAYRPVIGLCVHDAVRRKKS